MNEGFGKDFYMKGNSVKRFGPVSEPLTLKTQKLLSSSPSRKSALIFWGATLGDAPNSLNRDMFKPFLLIDVARSIFWPRA